MRILAKLIMAVLVNMVGLYAATEFVNGFMVVGGLKAFIVLAAILTVLNLILKPILQIILAPIIFITLGLGLVLVNALVLKSLTLFSPNLIIQGIPAFVLGALILSALNFVFHLSTKQ